MDRRLSRLAALLLLLTAPVPALAGAGPIIVGNFSGGTVTAPILFPSGSASAPSISFDGDTNLGWYRSAADAMTGVSAAGVTSLVIGNTRIQATVSNVLIMQMTEANFVTLAGTTSVNWDGRSITSSPQNGDWKFTNAAGTSTALLRATASGAVHFPDGVMVETMSAAVPAEPYVCSSSTVGTVVTVSDTNDTATTYLCYCGQQNDDSTYDWLLVSSNAACTAF